MYTICTHQQDFKRSRNMARVPFMSILAIFLRRMVEFEVLKNSRSANKNRLPEDVSKLATCSLVEDIYPILHDLRIKW